MIVNGFIEPVVKELPMEYAVELNRLIELQMEGSLASAPRRVLAARAPLARARGARRTSPSPTPRRKGWEFTDLSKLDLSGFAAAGQGRRGGRVDVDRARGARAADRPDPGRRHGRSAVSEVTGNGRPDGARRDAARRRRRALPRARRRAPRNDRYLGDDPFVADQRGRLERRRAGLRPRRHEAGRPDLADRHPGAGGRSAQLAHADRARGGRRGRGLGALRLRADGETDALFNGVTELIVGPAATLRYVCGQALSADLLGLRHPARRGRARRLARVGRARLRLRPRQGPNGDEARGPRRHRQGDRRLRGQRPPAPRLRHHAGARGRGHDLRPRLPRRPRRPLDRRLARDDHASTRAPSAPMPSRTAATCCSPTRRTPTRSPASRSRPTTSPAPTRRRSPRSTPNSSST